MSPKPASFSGASLSVVVGSGGVGKTTIAAALGLQAAQEGQRALVMTFDPSLRLKSALGVGDEARDEAMPILLPAALRSGAGSLSASLLDARRTFDRLVERYAPDAAAAERILGNRFYDQLSGALAGILEYMAVERLFEVAQEGGYERIVLDTPPTRQALDFLEAPDRIVAFLDSGVVKLASRSWFDERGRLKPARALGPFAGKLERYLDEVVGLDLLREMAEFFQAFLPLFAGFRARAQEVKQLLRAPGTDFWLVCGPAPERLPEALFFARKLRENGLRLGPMVVNRVHPQVASLETGEPNRGLELMAWLGERDRRGVELVRGLLAPGAPLIELPLAPEEPTDLVALGKIGTQVAQQLE